MLVMGNLGTILFFLDLSHSLGGLYYSAVSDELKSVFEEEYSDIDCNVWCSLNPDTNTPGWLKENLTPIEDMLGFTLPESATGEIPDYYEITNSIETYILKEKLDPSHTLLVLYTDGMFRDLYPEEITDLISGTVIERCQRVVKVLGDQEDRECIMRLVTRPLSKNILRKDDDLVQFISLIARGWKNSR